MQQPLSMKPSLSIKRGLESLNIKKTITFATENDEVSSAKRKSQIKRVRKPSQKEILAKIEPRYLSNSTISTLAKNEIDKRFELPSEQEINEKMEKYQKIAEKVSKQRVKIMQNGEKLKEKLFLSYLKRKNERQMNKLKTHDVNDYLKDLGKQYDRMLFDPKDSKRKRGDLFSNKMGQNHSLFEIFDKLKEQKQRQKLVETYFLPEQQSNRDQNPSLFLTDPEFKSLNYNRKKNNVGNPFAIYGSPELYEKILKDAEKGLPVSFPGIGITKTPFYRMQEQSKRLLFSENRTKLLNDLKFGIFPQKQAKIRHYSLENIKKELFAVYKYKNELEENKGLDAISKKLASIIKCTQRFWGKEAGFNSQNPLISL